MKVLLMCAGGFTTSLLVSKMKEFASEEDVINAEAGHNFSNFVDKYDVFICGPQVRYMYKDMEKKCKEKHKAIGLLDSRLYSTMDGKALYKQAKELYDSLQKEEGE